MTASAIVAHQLPGRVRLTIAAHRGDAGYFRQLAQRYAGVANVHAVRVNPAAASVVLEFDGNWQDLLQASGDLLALEAHAPPAPASSPVDREPPFTLVTGREVTPMFMAGMLFSAIGLVQSLRGRLMVPAVTAFWYATSTFQQARALAQVSLDISDGDE